MGLWKSGASISEIFHSDIRVCLFHSWRDDPGFVHGCSDLYWAEFFTETCLPGV